jgi:tetratricopeptide (TPR) repeat protein
MQEAQSLKAKGNLAVEKKDYQLALTQYTKAIILDPANTACLSNRSYVNLVLKNIDQAIDDARKCVEFAPQWSKVRFLSKPVETFSLQVMTFPLTSPKAHFRLGCALHARGFFSAAVSSFSTAHQLDGTSSEIESALHQARSSQYGTAIRPILSHSYRLTHHRQVHRTQSSRQACHRSVCWFGSRKRRICFPTNLLS